MKLPHALTRTHIIHFAIAGLAVMNGFAAEVDIYPKSAADFGSGASVREDFYLPGEESKGMFIGHPNALSRADRALVRFDLEPLLLKADKISKAELVLTFDIMRSQDPDESRQIIIEWLLEPVETLSGATVSTQNAERVAEYDVKRDDLINPFDTADGSKISRPDPVSIDVTKVINDELANGTSSITFRVSDARAEVETNNTGRDIGIIIPTGAETIPHLVIQIAE